MFVVVAVLVNLMALVTCQGPRPPPGPHTAMPRPPPSGSGSGAYIDEGYTADFSQCLPSFNRISLGSICVGFNMDTCDQTLHLNITYNGNSLINTYVQDLRTYEDCVYPTTNPAYLCSSCISFGSAIVNPAFASFCAQVTTKCTVYGREITSPTVTNLQCLEFGTNCHALTDCYSCGTTPGCGWCSNSTNADCRPVGPRGPYCDSCIGTWITKDEECPNAPLDIVESFAKTHRALVITLPVVVGSIGIVGICFLCRRKKPNPRDPLKEGSERSINPAHTHVQLNDDDDHSGSPNNRTALSINPSSGAL